MMNAILSPEVVFSSRLADPLTRSRLDLNQKIDWSTVLSILQKNKVPLVVLAQDPMVAKSALIKQAGFQRAAMRENESWQSLRYEYSLVRDGFLKHAIPNILIKSVGLAPSFPYTSDNLDVLIPPTEIETGKKVLNDLGYVELPNIEEPMKFLFRKFLGGESVSAIHLHGLVGWGGGFMDEESLRRGCRPSADDPLVIVPSLEDAVLITIAHAFYENKGFKLLDLVRIRYCFSHGNLDYAYMQRVSKERGWEDGLAFSLLVCAHLEKALYGESCIPEEIQTAAYATVGRSLWLRKSLEKTLDRTTIHLPFKVSFLLVKAFYYRKLLRDEKVEVPKRLRGVISSLAAGIKLKLHISGQRGMLISLSGIDGSGKTSIAEALVRAFATSEIEAHPFWLRFGSEAWLRKFKQLSQSNEQIVSSPSPVTSLEKRRSRLKSPALRLGWWLLNLAYMICLYNMKVRISSWLGSVVICDRYVYDALVEIEASLPQGSSFVAFSEWLLIHLCPKPDIAWLLDIPPEDAMFRQKIERGSIAAQKELAHQRELYLALQERYQMSLLSNQGDKGETASLIVLKTLRKYFKNYSTWVNGLLFSNPGQMNPEKKGL